MLFRKKKITYETRLEKYWDTYGAEEAYRLVDYEFVNGKLTRYDGEPQFLFRGTGDKEWAKRQMKHYGITITDPIEVE